MKLKTLTLLIGSLLLLQACASTTTVSSNNIETRIHTVKSGESLHKIAEKEYGCKSHWVKIYDANKDKIGDPLLIYPGQKIVLPR